MKLIESLLSCEETGLFGAKTGSDSICRQKRYVYLLLTFYVSNTKISSKLQEGCLGKNTVYFQMTWGKRL